jgi:hypothetical protein
VSLLLVILVAVVVAVPFAGSLLQVGEQTFFGCFAADAMYYLAIAKNSARSGFITFNQESATNGFQPLWQYLLVGVTGLLGPSLELLLRITFGLSLGLVFVGFSAVTLGTQRLWGWRVAAALPLLMLPGAFALLFEPSLGHASLDSALLYSFTGWAWVNGVESGLSIAAFGLLLMTVLVKLGRAGPGARSTDIFTPAVRVLLGIVVLSRLDDIFLPMSMALSVLLFDGGSLARRLGDVLRIMAPAALMVLAYLVYNLVSVGTLLPVSGLEKTSFVLGANLQRAASLIQQYRPEVASRILPILVMAASGTVILGFALVDLRRNRSGAGLRERGFERWLVLPISAYLLLKATFYLTMVDMWQQGWWYYSCQIFAFNFLLATGLLRILAERTVAYVFLMLLAATVTLSHSVDTGHRLGNLEHYARVYHALWAQRAALNARLVAVDPDAKVIGNTDGLYGLILDAPVGSGTGLTFSTEERREAAEKGKLATLVDRGFDVLPCLQIDGEWGGHYIAIDEVELDHEVLFAFPLDARTEVIFHRLSRAR